MFLFCKITQKLNKFISLFREKSSVQNLEKVVNRLCESINKGIKESMKQSKVPFAEIESVPSFCRISVGYFSIVPGFCHLLKQI